MQKWVRAHGLADRITFTGYVRGIDKARVFAESDIFAFPTTYPEGCPVSLLEALAAGLPVVCSAVGGMADVVEHERNGVVLEHPTVEATARGIRLFHENRALARRVGEANRAYAWSEFESGVVARLIADVYRRASSHGA
jgi:glycosyltransferase involved in cell wall biosynthesis